MYRQHAHGISNNASIVVLRITLGPLKERTGDPFVADDGNHPLDPPISLK